MNAPAFETLRQSIEPSLIEKMFAKSIEALAEPQNITSDNTAYQADISFAEFKRRAYSAYVETPYQKALDVALEQVALFVASEGRQGIGRLMVFMPPRHSKTLNVSKLFPAWFIGRNPDKRMITASYGATLATRNSRTVRNLIRSKPYREMFPDIELAHDSASAHEWDIQDREGGMIAAGVGGGITGHGAHLFIIDDPIKSRSEAESQIYRDNLKEWYGDAYTRLQQPGGAVVVMHTRWHEDDLAGYLINNSTDQWTILNFPALAESNDPLGRQVGEALWPERYGIDVLARIAETLGEYRFSAEYQQHPRPKAGNLFDTSLIKVVDYAPECTKVVRFYDLAVTTNKKSDYTVGVKMGVTADDTPVVLDVWREQRSAPDVQNAIAQNAAIDGFDVPIRLEAEKAGIVELDYLLRDPRMHNYRIDKLPPHGDKYTRAGPFAARVKAGRVLMVRGAWNRAYLDELSMFPSGAHDDQVDATSGAWDMLGHVGISVAFVDHVPAVERTSDGVAIEHEPDLFDLKLGGW